MAKRKITELVSDMVSPFLDENGMELYNIEFVKEGKDWFLRVYIDKKEGQEEEYVSTDDCEAVSRFLSSELDLADPIEQNYYLEVSSPGLDRVLLREKDFIRFTGRAVDVSLYKAFEGKKTYRGILTGFTEDEIIIRDEEEKELRFDKSQVVNTRLAVVF